MPTWAERRGGDSLSVPGRPACEVSVPCLAAGAAGFLLDLLFVVPGLPIDLSRHRQAGTILAHVAVLMLLVGLWPARGRALDLAARARPARRGAAIALAAALPALVVAALAVPWPALAHALCKEWGPIEPITVGVYVAGAWIAMEGARLRRRLGLRWRPFQLTAVLFAMLSLEEIDYLGIPSAVIGGRVGHVYVGSFHDLANVATWYPAVLPFLGGAVLAVTAVAWRGADLSVRFLWAEVRHVSSWVMVLGALLLVAAEVVDITADVPEHLAWLYRAEIEEPLELGGATLLAAGMLLKYCRDHGLGSRRGG